MNRHVATNLNKAANVVKRLVLDQYGIFTEAKALLVGKPQNELFIDELKTILIEITQKHKLPLVYNLNNRAYSEIRFARISSMSSCEIGFVESKMTSSWR